MFYFDKEKGEYVWLHFTHDTKNSVYQYENTTSPRLSVSFISIECRSVTIDINDSPEAVKTCKDFYALAKTTKSPYTLKDYQKGKKYLWTGFKEIEKNLSAEEIPVDWDIVIAVLMALIERGKITKKYQHAYIFKLLKQKECGTGCEKMTMDDYLEKLKNLDKTFYKIPTNNKIISKYIPFNDIISNWSVKEGYLQEAQKFAYSFVEIYNSYIK